MAHLLYRPASIRALLILVVTILLSSGSVNGQSGAITRVSVSSTGQQSNSYSGTPVMSADGDFVAFTSAASNLVANDTQKCPELATPSCSDVFVHDQESGTTSIASVSTDGTYSNGYSFRPAISDDGRFVAFSSLADNLVPNDTNESMDIFVHDRQTGQTSRVSVASDGTQANHYDDYYIYEDSPIVAISGDGRFVAFGSASSNLVPNDANNVQDTFVHDRQTGQTSRVSVSSSGTEGNNWSGFPYMSTDGRYVAFLSYSTNLVVNDSTSDKDVFIHDQQTHITTRVSISSDGSELSGRIDAITSMSRDGRFTGFKVIVPVFEPYTGLHLADVYQLLVHDRQMGETFKICQSVYRYDSDSASNKRKCYGGAMSADGRFVAYSISVGSFPGAVYIFDRFTTEAITYDVEVSQYGHNLAFSDDGRFLAFVSLANNLVPNDTNESADVFVQDRGPIPDLSTITGLVISSTDDSIADVSVTAGSYTTQVDATGHYTLTNMPAGQYSVTAIKDGYTFLPTFHTVTVPPDATGQDFVGMTTEETYSISGRMIGSNSVCVSGVIISASTDLSATTTISGTYSLTDLPMDTYTLTPSKSGCTFSPPTSEPITVPPNRMGLDFEGTDGESELDLKIDVVSPIQVLAGQELVQNKATAVKVDIHKTGIGTAHDVSLLLSHGSLDFTRFFVADLSNMDSNGALVADNVDYPLDFASGEVTKTVFFFSDDLEPTAGPYQVKATVDYLNNIAETDETNNSNMPTPKQVFDTTWTGAFPNLYIYYFRVDDIEIDDFDRVYQINNDFLRGVYPVSEQRFTPNRNSDFQMRSTRGFDGTFSSNVELFSWIIDAVTQLWLAHPTADRFIGVVPSGWFSQNTTFLIDVLGIAYPNMRLLVLVEATSALRPNGISTIIAAHEIGHSYGLHLNCEEYEPCNPTRQDNIGTYASSGLWVEKKIPMQNSPTRRIYSYMGGGGGQEYWTETEDYSYLLIGHAATTVSTANMVDEESTQAILAIGTFSQTGLVALADWYVVPEAEVNIPIPGPYTFEYQDSEGNVLYEQSFDISYKLGDISITQTPFAFTIPYIPNTERIVIKHNDIALAQKVVSSHSPTLSVEFPNGDEKLSGQLLARWSGSDGDGDSPTYTVLFSKDNGTTWEPIAVNLRTDSYLWDVTQLSAGSQYLVKVIATDGFNTSQDVSDGSFTIDNSLTTGNSVHLPLILGTAE